MPSTSVILESETNVLGSEVCMSSITHVKLDANESLVICKETLGIKILHHHFSFHHFLRSF